MKQRLLHVAIVVQDYDEALDFFINKLNFSLLEDTYQSEQDKRWVTVLPPGQDAKSGASILLARPSKPGQEKFIGNQTGGRVSFFLETDDFWRDYNQYKEKGIKFVRDPKKAVYGTVAVFEDLYGNLWDLIQLNP